MRSVANSFFFLFSQTIWRIRFSFSLAKCAAKQDEMMMVFRGVCSW